ncbi:LysR substrate-binding domain-containing protein [Pseudonocardia spinosispora]|uniref:LysR substrate-binding domain-containing protein n=1 Tax=Pseudonocardia spinosispora TaxID=103441 RepID=UPI00041A3D80|nr:LysR substrate-binding domain-containing protein [Pseudonocardia spinosispora]
MDESRVGDISFADLEMFLSFARFEHFGRAAAELEVSVATVQRGVRGLERKLGVELVEQAGRRVRLRHAGHVLAREAHQVLRARLDAVDTTRAESGRPHRLLRIAHTYSLGNHFVPSVLAELVHRQPELRFRCQQSSATDAVSVLLRGEADVAFTSLSPGDSNVVLEPLFTESLLLTVPAGDPIGTREAVSLRELRARRFVAMELGSSSRTHLVNACARAGFVPRITVDCSDLFVVESMVGAGLGVSVVPQGMADHPNPRVTRLPIDDPASSRTVFLAYSPTGAAHPTVRELAAIAREHGRAREQPLH